MELVPQREPLPWISSQEDITKRQNEAPILPCFGPGCFLLCRIAPVLEMRLSSFSQLAALCVCRGVFTSQKSPSVTIETREGWSEGRSPTVLFLPRNLTILLKYRKFLISRQATCSQGFPEAAVTERAARAGRAMALPVCVGEACACPEQNASLGTGDPVL